MSFKFKITFIVSKKFKKFIKNDDIEVSFDISLLKVISALGALISGVAWLINFFS